MAVQEQTPLQEYTANGIAKQFDLEFDCESADHLIVSIDGLEVLHTDWYLSGNAIVFHVAPASGKQVKIQRNTPFNRPADYQSYNNSFRPPAINKDFDRIWWKLQELGVADWILHNRIDALKAYVDQQDSELQQNIDNLKIYVDDKDDELRAYLMEEIRKQGVALDQLDDYYNYLMERLAQIAVDRGWMAEFVVDASGKTQQEINDLTGTPYRVKVGGYNIGERVVLENGDIVKSTVAGNTVDPNVDMTGWEFDNSPNSIITVNSVTEMLSLRVFDGLTVKTKSYNAPNYALKNPFVGGMTYVYNSSKSTENDSGSVINGWVAQFPNYQEVDVTWFGADPSGVLDSTNAVNKTSQFLTGIVDSSKYKMGVGNDERGVVRYPHGIFKQSEVVLQSGVIYAGQGQFATRIIPSVENKNCFVTKDTRSLGNNSNDGNYFYRLIGCTLKNMSIGTRLFDNREPAVAGAGGINIKNANWCTLENIDCRGLDGSGLYLEEVMDTYFNNIRLMYCGNTTNPSLAITDGQTEVSNALRFDYLHIEHGAKLFAIGAGTRHCVFNSPKFEAFGSYLTSEINGGFGISFNSAELTWNLNDVPMIKIKSGNRKNGATQDSSGIVFNSPQMISSSVEQGWYIENDAYGARTLIRDPFVRNASKLIKGHDFIIEGGSTYSCGSQLIESQGNSTIRNMHHLMLFATTTNNGTTDTIILDGNGNICEGNVFSSQAGSATDGGAYIWQKGGDDIIRNNRAINNSRQWLIRSTSNSSNHYENTSTAGESRVLSSGAVPRRLLTGLRNGNLASGGFVNSSVTVDAGATGYTYPISGSCLVLARGANGNSLIFHSEYGSTTLNTISSIGNIKTGVGVASDGNVYVTKEGASTTALKITNNSTSSVTLTFLMLSNNIGFNGG